MKAVAIFLVATGSRVAHGSLSGKDLLKHLGFNPSCIVDAGSNRGTWTRKTLKTFPEARYIMIDGNAKHESTVSDLLATRNVRVVFTILDDARRVVQWHTRGDHVDTGDSIFREESHNFHGVQGTARRSKTLDDVVEIAARKFNMSSFVPTLIKLDLQGAELRALSGGSRALASAEVVEIEMPVGLVYNRGAPTFAEYIAFMDRHGFVPFDMLSNTASLPVGSGGLGERVATGLNSLTTLFGVSRRCGPRNPCAVFNTQMDAIFVRKESPLLAKLQSMLYLAG